MKIREKLYRKGTSAWKGNPQENMTNKWKLMIKKWFEHHFKCKLNEQKTGEKKAPDRIEC